MEEVVSAATFKLDWIFCEFCEDDDEKPTELDWGVKEKVPPKALLLVRSKNDVSWVWVGVDWYVWKAELEER